MKLKLISIIILFTTFISCSSENSEQPIQLPVSNPTVYVSGYESNGINNVAKYWVNGIVTNLTDGTKDAQTSGIFVLGDDVYVCGSEKNNSGVWVAKYWKNGVPSILGNGTNNSYSTSIFVENNTVYVSGFTMDTNAVLWINNVENILGSSENGAYANKVLISNSDVYVAGSVVNVDNIDVAKIWKNNIEINLTNGVNRAYLLDMFLNGNDVYVCGVEAPSTAPFDDNAKYWKNGVAMLLSSNYSAALSIFVNENDVYTTGYEILDVNGSSTQIGRVWKNNQVINNLINGRRGYGINVFNNSIYVVGKNNSGQAALWKDGTETVLNSTNNPGVAESIFIKY